MRHLKLLKFRLAVVLLLAHLRVGGLVQVGCNWTYATQAGGHWRSTVNLPSLVKETGLMLALFGGHAHQVTVAHQGHIILHTNFPGAGWDLYHRGVGAAVNLTYQFWDMALCRTTYSFLQVPCQCPCVYPPMPGAVFWFAFRFFHEVNQLPSKEWKSKACAYTSPVGVCRKDKFVTPHQL